MSIEEINRAIVLRNFRAFDSGDFGTLEETTAPGFVDHNSLEGQLSGLKGTMQASEVYRAAFPEGQIVVEDTIAEADKVVIRSGHATHKGPFLDVPPLASGSRWKELPFSASRRVELRSNGASLTCLASADSLVHSV